MVRDQSCDGSVPAQKCQQSLVAACPPTSRTELEPEAMPQCARDAEPELVRIRTRGMILYGEQCEEQQEGSMLVNMGCPSLCYSLCSGAWR